MTLDNCVASNYRIWRVNFKPSVYFSAARLLASLFTHDRHSNGAQERVMKSERGKEKKKENTNNSPRNEFCTTILIIVFINISQNYDVKLSFAEPDFLLLCEISL